MTTKHLDLGCGLIPRNPYNHDEIHGCDIRNIDTEFKNDNFTYTCVNLTMHPIPYPEKYFDSVSAFDFLEHIPRQITMPSGEIKNSFVDLMSEIHRVLKPGGKLLAILPAYPHTAAFTDPTHVNFITEKTHTYFIGPNPPARIYGFMGSFEAITAKRDTPSNAYDLNQSIFRKTLRRLHRILCSDGLSHIIWELKSSN